MINQSTCENKKELSSIELDSKEPYSKPHWNELDKCYEIRLQYLPFPLKFFTNTVSVGVAHILFRHWREIDYMTFTEADEALFIDGEQKLNDQVYLKKLIEKNSNRLKKIGSKIARYVTQIHNQRELYGLCVFVTFDGRSVQLLYKKSQCEKKEKILKLVLADGLGSFPIGTPTTMHKMALKRFKDDPESWLNLKTELIHHAPIETIEENEIFYHFNQKAIQNTTFIKILWQKLPTLPCETIEEAREMVKKSLLDSQTGISTFLFFYLF